MSEKIVEEKETEPNGWQIVWAGSEQKAKLTFPNIPIVAVPTDYQEPVGLRMSPTKIKEIAVGKVRGVQKDSTTPSSIICATDTAVFAPGVWPSQFTSLFKPSRDETMFSTEFITRAQADYNGPQELDSMLR